MGITLHQDGDREYYRVTKAWNGKEIQKYIRIGRNRDAALRRARQVEESLAQRQRAALALKRLDGAGILHADGRITGLQLLYRTREGRTPWLEFKLRVKEPGKSVQFRTVSISAHGFVNAFSLAVDNLCTLRGLSQQSELVARMQATQSRYADDVQALLLAHEGQEIAGRARIAAEVSRILMVEPESDDSLMDAIQEEGAYEDYELALKAARSQFVASKPMLRG